MNKLSIFPPQNLSFLSRKSTFNTYCCVATMLVVFAFSCHMAQAQLKGATVPVGPPLSIPSTPAISVPAKSLPAAAPTAPETPAAVVPPAPLGSGNAHINANLSVLILALDDADLRHAPDWSAPKDAALSDKTSDQDMVVIDEKTANAMKLVKALNPPLAVVSNRPPGQAQMVAAPMRRMLLERGATNVLNIALDGPSMVRALNAARLSPRVVDMTRSTMRQIEQNVLLRSGQPKAIPAALQENAIVALTRIGQALGYRAVVAIVAPSTPRPGMPQALLLVVDTETQSGELIPLNAPSPSIESVVAVAGAFLIPRLSAWPPSSSTKIAALAERYLQKAKDAAAQNDLLAAQDYINQLVGLQPNNADAYETLGDLLQKVTPQAAATAYQRALNITPENGALWSKLAFAHISGNHPSWPDALDAAQHALSTGYDSAMLRTVMATAEFGRADIFAEAGRDNQADLANRQAKEYLDIAMKLAPQDSTIDADVSKLMATNLIAAKQFAEAATLLDLVARQYPGDLKLQQLYATALSGAQGRQEAAFVAWGNVWELEGEDSVPLSAARYESLANGFDKHIFNLAKAASMLTSSAASGNIPASSALPQVQRYAATINQAMKALHRMRPPAGRLSTQMQVARLIAGDMFAQAVQSYLLYLQNGDKEVLAHGGQLHYQAIARLNSARKGA